MNDKKNVVEISQGRLFLFKPKNILQHCNTVLLAFCLTGCMGVYEGGFECPAGQGVGCKSISEVNDLVNAGEIPSPSSVSIQKTEIWYSPSFIRESVKYKRARGKVSF